ncbi:DoxX family membrane protein [Candidatus Methylospira mobilis]|uniref:DoxX family membrane protein n=1 Tax=Candidatus Methylospira mobilis TaxID=1808979 RepID=A0A5Q0BK06_9GAMM|nr:DoxX family membrane protein [Candidatus Methylospira mobilis]QFY42497.1 DoxX family membrane protein [Candidatus Methylospira mobilis]WNV04395.1 DoxX family membrane protein [Candidatus Methylospira mobilis]
MTIFYKFTELGGRAFLATTFLLSGLGKIGHYAGTQAYMASAGVSGSLLTLVIVLEVAGAGAWSLDARRVAESR